MKIQLILSIFLILLFSQTSFAKTTSSEAKNLKCRMPKGETLTIGCTYNCGRFNRWAVKWYARKLGYRVKLINLSKQNQSMDYSQIDGVLIPGGADIDPIRYKNQVTPAMKAHIEKFEHLAVLTEGGKKRDQFEFEFVKKYFANSDQKYQPILGICRGMQVLTVSQGLPLYVDIKAELGIKNRRYTLDKVYVQNQESLIKQLIRRNKFRGVELHHQGLNMTYYKQHQSKWPDIEVTGTSHKNRIAEVLEFYNRPIIGTQFHPELTFGKVRRGLFKWLLKKSCLNHNFNKVLNQGK